MTAGLIPLYVGLTTSNRIAGYVKDGDDSRKEFAFFLSLGCSIHFRFCAVQQSRLDQLRKSVLNSSNLGKEDPDKLINKAFSDFVGKGETAVLNAFDYVVNHKENNGPRKLNSVLVFASKGTLVPLVNLLRAEALFKILPTTFVEVRVRSSFFLFHFFQAVKLSFVERLRIADLMIVLQSGDDGCLFFAPVSVPHLRVGMLQYNGTDTPPIVMKRTTSLHAVLQEIKAGAASLPPPPSRLPNEVSTASAETRMAPRASKDNLSEEEKKKITQELSEDWSL
jgi:hypothetical protein